MLEKTKKCFKLICMDVLLNQKDLKDNVICDFQKGKEYGKNPTSCIALLSRRYLAKCTQVILTSGLTDYPMSNNIPVWWHRAHIFFSYCSCYFVKEQKKSSACFFWSKPTLPNVSDCESISVPSQPTDFLPLNDYSTSIIILLISTSYKSSLHFSIWHPGKSSPSVAAVSLAKPGPTLTRNSLKQFSISFVLYQEIIGKV